MIAAEIMDVVVKGIIFHNGKMLIFKRSDDDEFGASTWEFVGGKVEFEEELEAALIRETKEESGLDITVDKLLYATSFQTTPSRKVILLKYICKSESDNVMISHEHSDYRWVTSAELRQYLPSHIMADLKKNHFFSTQAI
ncbi:NUDIX hydrolase [Fictibacillus barbaricus]|uniref:8-oxo-dGTP diphosphatase n=1 Tax=Fictibacillus barbaricus TaxID=182136 RepID=A0ABU1TWW7_9BACL|nr:NUDIX domain-containing protein [Fictibacillus barbaricus]MDR7071703.1 8-oxo-dGTP diphosphatase [Fictibacillus barbaricus]